MGCAIGPDRVEKRRERQARWQRLSAARWTFIAAVLNRRSISFMASLQCVCGPHPTRRRSFVEFPGLLILSVAQGRAFVPDLGLATGEITLGRTQQHLWLAVPLLGRVPIATDNQPFPRKVGRADLDQIRLVKQRRLQGVAALGRCPDM